MRFSEEGLELSFAVVVIVALIYLGSIVLTYYLNKANLTLGVVAMQDARKSLKNYQDKNGTYPTNIDFNDCSDQNGIVIVNCDEIKGDIRSFESYVGSDKTFVLKAKAKDSAQTLITITESSISF